MNLQVQGSHENDDAQQGVHIRRIRELHRFHETGAIHWRRLRRHVRRIYRVFGANTARACEQREVTGSYAVLLGIESMSKVALGSMSSSPLNQTALESVLHQDDLKEPLGSQPGKLLCPVIISKEEAGNLIKGPCGEFVVVRDLDSMEVVGRICSTEALDVRQLIPSGVTAKSIALECLRRACPNEPRPGHLLNFERKSLKDFAENPDLQMLDDNSDLKEHLTWQILSSMCYIYNRNMRKCIAECAYNYKQEAKEVTAISREFMDKSEPEPSEETNISKVLDLTQYLYDYVLEAKEPMKTRAPAMYNLMKPLESDRAKEPCGMMKSGDETFARIGCPEIKT